MPRRIAVIGAGISGLAAAHYLLTARANTGTGAQEVLVLESAGRSGGVIESVERQGVLMEFGPESFLTEKPGVLTLADGLGLASRIIRTSESHRRTLVAWNRSLIPLPDGLVVLAPTRLVPLMASRLFSPAGKLRMALEPFIRPAAHEEDESLASFVARRLGREAVERLAEPLISGIYGGAAHELSAASTIPRMVALERKYGSITRGLLIEQRAAGQGRRPSHAGPRYGLFASFDRGMGVLVERLVERMPAGTIRLNSTVDRILPAGGGGRCNGSGQWSISCRDGSTWLADAVILAVPAGAAGAMLKDAHPELALQMEGIKYSSSVISNWAFRCADIPELPSGFGFVVTGGEDATVNACTFASVKFQRRAPEGVVLLRVFVGGTLKEDAVNADPDALQEAIARDLYNYLGIKRDPIFIECRRHREVLPQYEIGHEERLGRIRRRIESMPGIAVAGNAYGGLGVPDCIASGEQAAQSVLAQLGTMCASRP